MTEVITALEFVVCVCVCVCVLVRPYQGHARYSFACLDPAILIAEYSVVILDFGAELRHEKITGHLTCRATVSVTRK
jgi:hypothetical protein